MKPKNFEEANINYTKPEGWTDEQCVTLPAFKNDEVIISCWEISDEELEVLKVTKEIWFYLHAPVQVPIILTADNPFQTESAIEQRKQVLGTLKDLWFWSQVKDNGNISKVYCDRCDEEKEWSDEFSLTIENIQKEWIEKHFEHSYYYQKFKDLFTQETPKITGSDENKLSSDELSQLIKQTENTTIELYKNNIRMDIANNKDYSTIQCPVCFEFFEAKRGDTIQDLEKMVNEHFEIHK